MGEIAPPVTGILPARTRSCGARAAWKHGAEEPHTTLDETASATAAPAETQAPEGGMPTVPSDGVQFERDRSGVAESSLMTAGILQAGETRRRAALG